MGGLPSSTGQLPSAADGSRIDAIPNGRIASAANTNGRAGRWGGPPSTYAVWSRCRISGPSVRLRHPVRTLSIRRLGCPGISQGPRHLCPLVLALWDRGENISGPSAPVSPPSRPFWGCVSGPSAPALPGRGAGPLGVPGRAYQGPRHLRPLPLPPCLEAWGEACQGPRHLRYPPLTRFLGGRPPPCPTECPRSRRCPRRGRWRPRSPVPRRAPRPSTSSGR